jgi:cytochrome c biogenesis protein CcdA
VLITVLRSGASVFGIQKFIATYGELILPPSLLLVGLFMLFGNRLNLPSFGFGGKGEGLVQRGGVGALMLGVLFSMVFCPTCGVLYFGMLIPMSASATMGYMLPILFAVATSLPVLVVSWILAFSAGQIGTVYGKMQTIQKWLNIAVGVLFIVIGIYYCLTIYI